MVLGHIIGATLIAPAVIYKYLDTPKRRWHKKLCTTLETYGLYEVEILGSEKQDYGWKTTIRLPHGLTVDKFKEKLGGIEQSTVSKIKFHHETGRICKLHFGMFPLSKEVKYENVPKEGMKIPLATPFGFIHVDFIHLVGGGATGMGKTVFQLLLATHFYTQSKGKARILISSSKKTDYYMFKNLPNLTLVGPDDTLSELIDIVEQYKERAKIIEELGNVKDYKDITKKHPDKTFQPIYAIIDECGVFSEDDDVKEQLQELVERARYVDIHVILLSQRPDVKVLNERIKANLLTRIAFTTASDKDSRIILGIDGAEKLGEIPGRAILIQNLPEVVQVPFISDETAENLLKPYYRSVQNDEPRSNDSEAVETFPSFITGPIRGDDLPRSGKTVCNDQSNNETPKSGWFNLADSPTKG